MSTQRYISTSFWDDEWIQTLDPSEKLLYLYFMTNPLTNIAGVYKVTERRVSFDTGFNISTIQHIMSKFEKAGKVFRHGEWIALPTWPKHQRVSDRDNNRKGIDAILKALPDDVFAFIVEKGYKYIYLNELGRALEGASTTFNYSNLDIDIESNLDIDIESDLRKTPDKPATPEKTKKTKKEFIPPTLEEVTDYIIERRIVVIPFDFINWYTKTDWKDTSGKKITNWKNKLLNWDARELKKNPGAKPYSKPSSGITGIVHKCPVCQGVLKNGQYCKTCDKFFDDDGKELYQ